MVVFENEENENIENDAEDLPGRLTAGKGSFDPETKPEVDQAEEGKDEDELPVPDQQEGSRDEEQPRQAEPGRHAPENEGGGKGRNEE